MDPKNTIAFFYSHFINIRLLIKKTTVPGVLLLAGTVERFTFPESFRIRFVVPSLIPQIFDCGNVADPLKRGFLFYGYKDSPNN